MSNLWKKKPVHLHYMADIDTTIPSMSMTFVRSDVGDILSFALATLQRIRVTASVPVFFGGRYTVNDAANESVFMCGNIVTVNALHTTYVSSTIIDIISQDIGGLGSDFGVTSLFFQFKVW